MSLEQNGNERMYYKNDLVDIPLDDDLNQRSNEYLDENLNKKRNPIIQFIMSYILFPLMLLIFIFSCGYLAYKYVFPKGFLDNIPGFSYIKKLIDPTSSNGSNDPTSSNGSNYPTSSNGSTNPLLEDNGVFISNEDLKNKKFNYIFGTINAKGEKYFYQVPDNGKNWYNPAMGIRTSDIFEGNTDLNKQDGLNYDGGGDNNPNMLIQYYGIEFQDNNNTIFKFSPDGDANNSKGQEGINNAMAVFNLEAPDGYIPEPLYLYRKKTDTDYVYKVFKKNTFIPPMPNYIMQTINNKGKINTYVIPDEKLWIKAKNGIKSIEINDINYDGGSNNSGKIPEHYGIEFKENSKIFTNSTNKNNPNSWGCCAGKNNCNAVYALKAPDGYTKEIKYLYRQQTGPDYCYAVFKNNKFNESDIDLTTVDAPIPRTTYIFQSYNSDGILNEYNMTDPSSWISAINGNKAQGVRTLDYNGGTNKVGTIGAGIEFENNSNTVFITSSDYKDDNSYGHGGKNTSDAVYALTAPSGYVKEPKYLYRYRTIGADFVYAVFKKI